MLNSECFMLPEYAGFYNLFELRHEPDNGERETNGNTLRDAGKPVFQNIRDNESNNTRITTKTRRKIPEKLRVLRGE